MSGKNVKIDPDKYATDNIVKEQREQYHSMCEKELFAAQLNNFLWNISTIQTKNYSGILGFDKIFKGKPAIVVGVGPSLDKNAHLLKKYRNNVVIVACDAALQPLVKKHGVYPHIVTMVDPTPKQKNNFEGIDTTKFYTIAPPIVHPSIFRTIDPQHLAIYNLKDPKNPLFEQAPYHTGKKGALPAAVLSTGTAFCFAAAMGCDPAIFIGQDLSWPDTEHIYATGVAKGKKTFQKMAKFRGNCMLFPDINGKLVITHQTLFMFWAWLRDNTKMMKTKIVNSSEAGILKFKGVKVMPLQKSLDKYCSKEIVDIEGKIKKAYNDRYSNGQVEDLLLPTFKKEYQHVYQRMGGK